MIGQFKRCMLRMILCAAIFLIPAVAFADIYIDPADQVAERLIWVTGAALLSVIACIVAIIVFLKPMIYRAMGIAGVFLCVPLYLFLPHFVFFKNIPITIRLVILAAGLPILVTVVFVTLVRRYDKKHLGRT